MALRVRCKSTMKDAPLPYWPVSPVPCAQQQLPQQAFMPLAWQQQALTQPVAPASSTGGCNAPIVVQAPAAPAPIVIQSPPLVYPMPMQYAPSQTVAGADAAIETDSHNQTQGQAMPAGNSERVDYPQYTGGNTGGNTEENGQNSAQIASSHGSRASGAAQSQSAASPQPIIINIHNSQDTASNNRSLFAPKVNDESRQFTRLHVGSEQEKQPATAQAPSDTLVSNVPIPIVKTPLPTTTPGARLDQQGIIDPESQASNSAPTSQEQPSAQVGQPAAASEAQPQRTRYVLMKRGRLLHLKPVDAVVAEQDPALARAQTAPSQVRKASNRTIHYVGWS